MYSAVSFLRTVRTAIYSFLAAIIMLWLEFIHRHHLTALLAYIRLPLSATGPYLRMRLLVERYF